MHLTVTTWHDPLVEHVGYPAGSHYVERFWLPAIGPTALLTYRRLDEALEQDDPARLDLSELAASMGVGREGNIPGKNHPLTRALGRLTRFGLVRPTSASLELRRLAPPLPLLRQKRHLSAALQAEHAALLARDRLRVAR